MTENDELLSDGAKAVMTLLTNEPKPPKFKTIDPALADDLTKVLNEARRFTDMNMTWLNGIYVDLGQFHEILFLVEKIRKALTAGAKYEGDWWDGVADSQAARNGFIGALLKGTENGRITFNEKTED